MSRGPILDTGRTPSVAFSRPNSTPNVQNFDRPSTALMAPVDERKLVLCQVKNLARLLWSSCVSLLRKSRKCSSCHRPRRLRSHRCCHSMILTSWVVAAWLSTGTWHNGTRNWPFAEIVPVRLHAALLERVAA